MTKPRTTRGARGTRCVLFALGASFTTAASTRTTLRTGSGRCSSWRAQAIASTAPPPRATCIWSAASRKGRALREARGRRCHLRRGFMRRRMLSAGARARAAERAFEPADQRDFETILRESRALPPRRLRRRGRTRSSARSSRTTSRMTARTTPSRSSSLTRRLAPPRRLSDHDSTTSSRNAARVQRARGADARFGTDVARSRRAAQVTDAPSWRPFARGTTSSPRSVEPLPEAEHRLFEYLFDRQPDNQHFSYSDPTPLTLRAKDDASAKRRAETRGRELLDLFAENAAMHAFSDAVVRVDGRELDDRLELWDGPVWRAARRRGGAAVAEGASSGQGETREEVSEASENAERRSVDRFGLEDVEDHAGCAHFSGARPRASHDRPPVEP